MKLLSEDLYVELMELEPKEGRIFKDLRALDVSPDSQALIEPDGYIHGRNSQQLHHASPQNTSVRLPNLEFLIFSLFLHTCLLNMR